METPIENDFTRNVECLRKTLKRISDSRDNNEIVSSYDIHDCFILLNIITDVHNKEISNSRTEQQ